MIEVRMCPVEGCGFTDERPSFTSIDLDPAAMLDHHADAMRAMLHHFRTKHAAIVDWIAACLRYER